MAYIDEVDGSEPISQRIERYKTWAYDLGYLPRRYFDGSFEYAWDCVYCKYCGNTLPSKGNWEAKWEPNPKCEEIDICKRYCETFVFPYLETEEEQDYVSEEIEIEPIDVVQTIIHKEAHPITTPEEDEFDKFMKEL